MHVRRYCVCMTIYYACMYVTTVYQLQSYDLTSEWYTYININSILLIHMQFTTLKDTVILYINIPIMCTSYAVAACIYYIT